MVSGKSSSKGRATAGRPVGGRGRKSHQPIGSKKGDACPRCAYDDAPDVLKGTMGEEPPQHTCPKKNQS